MAGAGGFIMTGWGETSLPDSSLGYVYWPAFLCIVAMSFPFARVGARLAHRLPAAKLKKIFAALLVIVGVRLVWAGVAQL